MTNPSKLEQVARAIQTEAKKPPPSDVEHWNHWSERLARAAIAAMQLPEMAGETAAHEIAAPKFDAWWEKG